MKNYDNPTYRTWKMMKARCNNTRHKSYKYYGGKGITYDPRWESFDNFLLDMGERPLGTTLERKDGTKDYCKENCKWATYIEQNRNLSLRHDNLTGIRGVSFVRRRGKWEARVEILGKVTRLYYGTGFFEACCARKSYERGL